MHNQQRKKRVSEAPTSFWLCHIDHKHGENYTLHHTEERAREEAYQYVADNWSEYEAETDDLEAFENNKDKAIETYFERAGHFGGEWLRIEELEISE